MEGKEAAARPPNPALPYREDCWSEGATSTLIDAWGERYLDLNRGNLRQKHWQEVADVVNSRRTAVRRPARTDIQCKNRIDTLKKKYKLEKTRIAGSGGASASQWPFYERLEVLIGPSAPFSQKPSSPPPLALPLPYRKSSPLPAATATARPSAAARERKQSLAVPAEDSSFLKRKYSAVAAAAAAAAAHKDEEVDSESSKSSTERSAKRGGWRASNNEGAGGSVGDEAEGVRELARAILRFGEIYERVEAAKQQQMLELEKQRMEFAKGLEFQRMQIFVDSQVQLEKLKRSKRATSGTRNVRLGRRLWKSSAINKIGEFYILLLEILLSNQFKYCPFQECFISYTNENCWQKEACLCIRCSSLLLSYGSCIQREKRDKRGRLSSYYSSDSYS